ncbi:unnamed protein product [Aureobasidium mustum]|uniref:Uncharacterized protein n=1 Tax=Aureobasidium mustum TaxID=2773714 RepID=A0A9N8JQR4_9PEZI|nr:unnamed protein product [Aureobasidium mustum]
MPSVTVAPRELLWYHQMQRENRHLLEQVKRQQADLDKIKSQSSADQEQREQIKQRLSELETKQATTTDRRREDFEREKEILKRVGKLEESFETLRRANDSQPMATAAVNQWQTLEQRLDMLEQRHARVPELDVQQLNQRINALAKVVNNPVKDPRNLGHQHANNESMDQAAGAGDDATRTSGGRQIGEEKGKEKMQTEREPSLQRRSSFVQTRRRAGEKLISFRPTPPDLAW